MPNILSACHDEFCYGRKCWSGLLRERVLIQHHLVWVSIRYSFRFCEILVCDIILLMIFGRKDVSASMSWLTMTNWLESFAKNIQLLLLEYATQHSAHAKLKILFFHVMPWQVVYKKSQWTIQYYYILGMKLLIHLQLSQFRISLIFYEFVVSLVLIFLNRVIVWLQSFFSEHARVMKWKWSRWHFHAWLSLWLLSAPLESQAH